VSREKKYAGTTSNMLTIFVQSTASTTGGGLAGLTHSTSGLVAEYRRRGQSSWTSITLVSKTLGTYTSGGFVADGSLDGAYEFDPPDAAFAAGAEWVAIRLRGAANMLPVLLIFELDAVNYQDATAFGLSRIDAAITSRMATYTQPTGFLAATFPTTVASPTNITSATGVVLAATTHTGAVIPTVTAVTNAVTVGTNNDKTGYSLTQAFPANFASLDINASGHVSRVVLVDTTTTNTDMRGTDGAALATNWTATRAGYLDGVLIAANYNQRTVSVTGSNHVAADIHELQPAVIDNTHFAAGAIDANAIAADAIGASELAADAVTEIVAGMATQPQLVDLATMITNDGTANARFSTSALQNAPTGGGGGTGTGARTVTITVTLSAAPVEGASVRLTKAAETYVGTTNASGVVTFNVDDGTWTVSITSPNATFAGASLVVDDAETVSYSLTAVSITPSPAGQMTGYWTCYSHLGVVESGVSVTMQLVDVPKGSKGLALDSKTRTVTANGSGVAQFTNLFPGCRYKVYRGAADNKAFYVTLPEVAPADPVELGSFYGDDE